MNINRVGFIGLGNMGMPIALNLAVGDFELQVFDVNAAAVAELVRAGAIAASSPAQMAAACEVVCICVRDDNDVEQVLNGAEGIFRSARSGLHVVVHSTVTSGAFRRWARQARALDLILVDAAVTGGATVAAERGLCYMVGGPENILEYLRPLFALSSASGGCIVHAGPTGAGLVLKLANNTMAFFAFVAMHEGARLVAAGGGSLEKLYEVGSANGVVTPQMRRFLENRSDLQARYSNEEFKQRFLPFATLVEKDLYCALRSGAEMGAAMPAAHYLHGVIRQVFLDEC